MPNSKIVKIIVAAAAVLVLLTAGLIIGLSSSKKTAEPAAESTEPATESTMPASYQINGVNATLQDTLKAGCETHACTSLLQSLGYDIDEFAFADNYLDCHYVYEGEDGQMYGPDMNSAFAGTAYAGWGIYAPAMARCMNNYLKDVKSSQKASVVEAKSLRELCEKYIVNGIPVMVWATTDMQEPIPWDVWKVNYVDENAKFKEGDDFTWLMHEHCLVLCGYDEKDYLFSDSVVGGISHFEKSLSEKRFEQLGYQAIVVE